MAGNMIQRANARATLLMLDESGMSTVEYAIGTQFICRWWDVGCVVIACSGDILES